MKLLFDFLPILLFFIAYKVYGIYVATLIAIATALIQVIGYWVKYKRIETMYIVTLITLLVLGTATLVFHNEMYIKWKPTALYWLLAILFTGSHFLGKKTLTQRMMETKLSLPQQVWQNLNWSWSLFFAFLGVLNLYVVYHYSTSTWVNFKLFGTLGLTILFVIFQGIYMAKHLTIEQK